MIDVKEDGLLDARGLMCPMPIVLTAKEMKSLEPGQTLKVLATDKGALADFPAWAEDTENPILDQGETDGVLWFLIQKAEDG